MPKSKKKALLALVIGILIAILTASIGESTDRTPYKHVRGYRRSDGVYVRSYKKALPGYRKKRKEHWAIFNFILITDFFGTVIIVLYKLNED